jgi:membrane-associated protein
MAWLQDYGYPVLWLSVFVAAIGAPLPISLMLMGAGAIATFGDFNIVLLICIAASAAIAGDSVGYVIGRHLGSRLLDWLEHKRRFPLISARAITQSRLYFQKRGGWAIFLSRFLFSALGGPINLLAGAELYPYRRFLAYDASGEALGVCIPLTLGFIFGASWEAIGDMLGGTSIFIVTVLIAFYLTIQLIKLARRLKMAAYIQSPRTLHYKDAPGTIAPGKTDTLPL